MAPSDQKTVQKNKREIKQRVKHRIDNHWSPVTLHTPYTTCVNILKHNERNQMQRLHKYFRLSPWLLLQQYIKMSYLGMLFQM